MGSWLGFLRVLLCAFVCGVVAACGAEEQKFVERYTAPVVYGDDDRVEVYEHPSATLREIGQNSVVALINSEQLERQPDGRYGIFAVPLGLDRALCSDQSFLQQPSAAICSGVWLGGDLVLTAGHCVQTEAQCRRRRFVFDYRLAGPGVLERIDDDDVYQCQQIAQRGDPGANGFTPDFAVIQLDRTVTGDRQPVPIRPATDPVSVDESITMIGFGSGLPAKIDDGGIVADPRAESRDFFVASPDAFGGHSGSATFDSNDELAGILVAGRGPDYVSAPVEGCNRVNVFPDSQAGEVVAYVAPVIERLCAAGWGGDDLCGDTACDGEPCGAKAPGDIGSPGVNPGGSGGIPPAADSSGCQSTGGGPTTASVFWFGALVAGLVFRARRRAV